MEELEAIREAEEAALQQAELAAEEAAMGLYDEDEFKDEDISIHSQEDENHVKTPSTRSLSRDNESSAESFKNPTRPLKANGQGEAGRKFESPSSSVAGMTNSAVLRHVSYAFIDFSSYCTHAQWSSSTL